jgi:hypothetical protein
VFFVSAEIPVYLDEDGENDPNIDHGHEVTTASATTSRDDTPARLASVHVINPSDDEIDDSRHDDIINITYWYQETMDFCRVRGFQKCDSRRY